VARRTRTRSVRKGDLGKLVAAVALVVATAFAASAGLYLWLTAPRPPARDQTTFCPTDGPRAITVMLLDTSDPLPEATKEDATRRLTDIADGLPEYALLDIRILDPASPAGRQVFFLCNPGDGRGLNEFTGNPRLAQKRWRERFRAPLDQALNRSLIPNASETSPLLATLQGIALDKFAGKGAAALQKTLVIVSDMIENGKDYSQYQGDLTYHHFKETPAYRKLRTDLNGAQIQILYVERFTKRPIDPTSLMRFWAEWVQDNGGQSLRVVRLQGAGK
jgi:hypothetical protein